MCQVRHTAGLHLCDSSCVHELGEKPKTNQERCWNESNFHEYKNEQDRLDLIPRIGHDKRAHHRSNGSACAQIRNCGMSIGQDLGKHGYDSASQIENGIATATTWHL